jgi:hypothetical protein
MKITVRSCVQLADEITTQAKTLDDVNGRLNVVRKSALERVFTTMPRHPGTSAEHHTPRHGVAIVRLLIVVERLPPLLVTRS